MYEEIFGVEEVAEPGARSAVTFVPNRANPAKETKSCTRPSEGADIERESDTDAAPWVVKVLTFLEHNGQGLLSSICAHYRIEFDGDLASVGRHSRDQLVHSCIFNPALPKSASWLPKMLRDISSVTDWRMTFLKNDAGIYRSVRVAARLNGEDFDAQCRCCSYCGSCFSGRFMKGDIVHQQAGGWKEITQRTAAGQHSWSSLRGWRLCVPCFSHWSSKGTHANRKSIDELMCLHKDFITSEPSEESSYSLSSELAVVHQQLDVPGRARGGRDANESEESLSLREADGSDVDDSLFGAERWPSPNPDSSHVTPSSSTPTPSQADAVARDKDEDLEDLALKQHSLQVEDAVHVLLSISTSLALNDAANDLLSMRNAPSITRPDSNALPPKIMEMRTTLSPLATKAPTPPATQTQPLEAATPSRPAVRITGLRLDGAPDMRTNLATAKERMRKVESTMERASMPDTKPKKEHTKPKKEHTVCARCFQVFKSPHALHGHMRHCKKSVDRMAHSNHYTGGGKKPMERVDGGAGSSQLANGTRKRLHGIKLQGMSKDERAKWCVDLLVPKGKMKRKASPVASARAEWQEGSAMQTTMQAAFFERDPKAQKRQESPSSRRQGRRHGALEADVHEGDIESGKLFYDHLIDVDRVDVEEGDRERGKSRGTANVSARFAAAVAGRWPEVAASALPRFSPITPEVGRSSRGESCLWPTTTAQWRNRSVRPPSYFLRLLGALGMQRLNYRPQRAHSFAQAIVFAVALSRSVVERRHWRQRKMRTEQG